MAALPKLGNLALSSRTHSCYPKWAFAGQPLGSRRPRMGPSAHRSLKTLAVASSLPQGQIVTTLPDKKYHPSPLSQAAPTTYAVIELGGVQMFVEPGKRYKCNRLKVEEGSTVQFPRVLLCKSDGTPHFGAPYLSNATVQAEILEHVKGDKIIVYKMKPKKHYRRKYGHRQHLTSFQITSIAVDGVPEELKPVSADTIDKMIATAIENKKISADSKDTYKKQLSGTDAALQLKSIALLVL